MCTNGIMVIYFLKTLFFKDVLTCDVWVCFKITRKRGLGIRAETRFVMS